MDTPGLFPETPARGPSRPAAALSLIVLAFLLLLGLTLWQVSRLKEERDASQRQVDELLALMKSRPVTPPPPPAPSPDPPPLPPLIVPEVVPAPRVTVRVLPTGESPQERIAQGIQEFKAGRTDQAELQFFRAVPDAYVHLLVARLAQDDVREAFSLLTRAAGADLLWFKKLNPRSLFGTAEAFEKMLASLEARVRADPLDRESKTLLAYLHYHEKGAAYAKALLVEVLAADPGHAAAKGFLENVDK